MSIIQFQRFIEGDLAKRQEAVVNFFEAALHSQKLANAYLFLGDAQIDKLEMARELAQILNCEVNAQALFNENTESKYQGACGTCTNCKWIIANTHPATPLVLEPKETSKKGIISIDLVKELQSELSKSANYYRVIIIPDASYMVLNKHSANALLKTIEEPSSNVLFILCANDREQVLATILSRTQQVYFKANPKRSYSEEAEELFDNSLAKLEELITLGPKISKEKYHIEAILLAEELAGNDNGLLLEFLEILQDHWTSNCNSLELAGRIMAVEKAKKDLYSFVRAKAALEQMLLHCA